MPVVYGGIGKSTFEGPPACLAVRGFVLSFGNASGPPPAVLPATPNAKGSLHLTRPTAYHYWPTQADRQRATHDALASRTATGATPPLP